MRSSSETQVRASTHAPPQPPRKLSLTFCLGPRCSCAAREGSLEAQPRHRQAWLALAAASLKLPPPLCICTKTAQTLPLRAAMLTASLQGLPSRSLLQLRARDGGLEA